MTDHELAARVARECLWHADAKLDELGWDQPPQLWVVVWLRTGELAALGLVPFPSWAMVRHQLPEPWRALAFLLDAVKSSPELVHEMLPPEDVFGMALSCEAWSLHIEPGEKDFDARMATVANHEIDAHPDKVEVRMIHLAPADGPAAMLNHERGGLVHLIDESDKGPAGGRIPFLLRELAKAVAGS